MENLRGAAFMTLAMLGFAIEDGLIKALTSDLPAGQIIALIGAGGAVVLALWFRSRGQPILPAAMADPRVIQRTAFEVFGTLFFVSAIARAPITTLSAIIQATPLVVAMGAALFLGQPVGWRRWSAILIGFAGVIVILRPTGDFEPALILGVIGMLGLAARDLTTRALKVDLSGAHLSLHAFSALVPAGLLLTWVEGTPLIWPDPRSLGLLALAVAVGLLAYIAIVLATRSGNAAFISSFRYTRMPFALGVGILFLDENPDRYTYLGAAIIIASGIYALWREAQVIGSKG